MSKKFLYNVLNTVIGAVVMLWIFILFLNIIKPILKDSCKNEKQVVFTALGAGENEVVPNNIKISEIIVNNTKKIDLKELDLENNWTYSADSETITCSDFSKDNSIKVNLDNVYSLQIRIVKNRGGGNLKVNIDGKSMIIDCYEDNDWYAVYENIYSNIFIYPELHNDVIGFAFVLCLILTVLIRKRLKGKSISNYDNCMITLFEVLLVSVIIVFSFEWLFRENLKETMGWFLEYKANVILEVAFTWMVLCVFVFLLGNLFIGVLLGYLLFLILSLINTFKIRFRETPITPWDFQLISETMSVISDFQLKITPIILVNIGLFLIILSGIYISYKKQNWKMLLRHRALGGAFLVVVIFHFFETYVSNTVPINLFNIKEYYSEYGVENSFLYLYKKVFSVQKPENYSKDVLDDVYIETTNKENLEDISPNFLIILGESYWDVNRVNDIIIDENPLQNYYNLQKEAVYGEALVNVFGGGTVNSEWEVLTGFSSMFLTQDQMPYQNCVKENSFSIVRWLKEKGYNSFAIHPYVASNYNRNQAYYKLGVEELLFEEDFEKDAERIRGFISDNEVYKMVLRKGEESKDTPWLGIAITMENHGGYAWEEKQIADLNSNYSVNLNLERYDKTHQIAIRDLVYGIKAKDEALKTLIEIFEDYDKPTIIVYFGDHMVDALNAGNSFLDKSDLYEGKNELEKIFEQHRVPFFIWSNYETKSENVGLISLNQLLPITFETFQLERPKFWNYLLDMNKNVGVAGNGIYIDKNGKLHKFEETSEKDKEYFHNYEILQFDQIFGDHFFSEWFN